MKTSSITFSMFATIMLLFVFIIPSFSQETIEVKVEEAVMSKGMQPGYVVNIPMAVLKDVQDDLIKRLQENNKTKVIDNKGELSMPNVVISEITKDTISIYTLLIEKEGGVVMNVFVEIENVFFSPSEDKTQLSAEKTDSGIKNYIRRFAVEQYRLFAEKDLEAEQKILEDLENEYEKLGKEIENLNKDIASLENNIEKTERNITSLDQEIELKSQEILTHKTSMQSLSSEIEKKAAQDKDKELVKEKNKLEKERLNSRNDISDMKADIEKNKKSIIDNEKLMEEKTEEINLQKGVVANAQKLLEGIK